MGDADQQDNRQNTPAAHEFKVEGREYPAPDQLHAFRSFYSNSLKDFATTARSERERIVESRDDSIVRPTSGAGSDKPRTMRPQITTGRDGSDSTTTTRTGAAEKFLFSQRPPRAYGGVPTGTLNRAVGPVYRPSNDVLAGKPAGGGARTPSPATHRNSVCVVCCLTQHTSRRCVAGEGGGPDV